VRYGSVCSGIEAASVAWHSLGWQPSFYSEIEKFPRGLRGGLGDDRGNLALEYCLLADRLRPRWIVWENVPGVFSIEAGEAFASILSGLVRWNVTVPEGGWKNTGFCQSAPVDGAYGVAWRVLDAQFFGVAQRRRRVFLVGYAGDWRRAAAVLLEPRSLRRDSPPNRETGQGFAHDVAPSLTASGRGVERCGESRGQDPVVAVLSSGEANAEITEDIAPNLNCNRDGAPIAFNWQNGGGYGAAHDGLGISVDHSPPQSASQVAAAAFHENQRGEISLNYTAGAVNSGGGKPGQGYPAVMFKPSHYTRAKDGAPSEIAPPLCADADKGDQDAVALQGMVVRRLTPVECERLQGFPDNYTRIPWRAGYWSAKDHSAEVRAAIEEACPDGPRYRALGNSMAVPVMRWIGARIQKIEDKSDE